MSQCMRVNLVILFSELYIYIYIWDCGKEEGT